MSVRSTICSWTEGRGFRGCGKTPHRGQPPRRLTPTTPAPKAPPLLNQEGSWPKNSPPQMRRGGAPSAGVVLNRQ